MTKHDALLWLGLAVFAVAAAFAAGRLTAPRFVPEPTFVPDTAGRVPVITLKRQGGGVLATSAEAEARFIAGGSVIVVPPGESAVIPLP